MKSLADILGAERDSDGVRHVNKNARGCPYCGAVELKEHVVDGITKTVFYHGGAECCAHRMTDQITWRDQELNTLQKDLNAKYEHIDRLKDQAEHAFGQEKSKLEQRINAAEAGMKAVEEGFKERRDALQAEKTRLQKRRAWLTRQEQEEPA